MQLQHLEVGKPYKLGIVSYPEEIKFDFAQSGAILALFFPHIAEAEINSVRSGDLKVGFIEKNGIIFMLFKFESLPWMDAPYTVHLSQLFEFMEVTEGAGYSIQIYLIDADTGILKVIRLVGMGTTWSRSFREEVLRQKQLPFDKRAYDISINRTYDSLSIKDMISLVLPVNFYKIRR